MKMEQSNREKVLFVSIIMPAYNAAKSIEDAVMSVLKQSFANFELIVVDDFSKDSTVEIVASLAKIDNRIHLLKNERNRGVSATRYYGISAAKGEWIAFLDSDDMWRSDKLEKQVNLINCNKNANLVFTGSSFISENGSRYSYVFHVPKRVTFKQLLKQNVISCSSVLVRKKYLEAARMEWDDIHEDFAVWLKILRLQQCAYSIDEPLLIYRISKSSRSGNKLNSARMTFKTYRYSGLSGLQSLYYMFFYMIAGILKYKRIQASQIKGTDSL